MTDDRTDRRSGDGAGGGIVKPTPLSESDLDEIEDLAKANAATTAPVAMQESTLAESPPRITIVNEIPSQPLWATPLLLFLGAVLAVGSSTVANWIVRSREQRSNRDQLLSAFLAEVQINARTLKNAMKVTAKNLESDRLSVPLVGHLRPKAAVYDANLNRLGEFSDPHLTEEIASTYAHYNTAEEMAEAWRERPDGDEKTDDLRVYWCAIASAAYSTTLLRGMLELRTEHLRTPRALREAPIPEPIRRELGNFLQVRKRILSLRGDRDTE